MDGFVADLRFAARLLIKAKGFTIVAVLALALGIGGTTVMYSAVDGVLMRPLPYPHAERVVRLWERWGNGGTGSVSWPNLQDWRAQSRTLELLSGVSDDNLTLVRDGLGERMAAARVTQDFFALVGVQPALGRLFSADAFVHGNEVLVSHEVWLRRFRGENKVLGQSVRLSDSSYVVIGVLPAGFHLPASDAGVYLPFVPDANAAGRGNHFLRVIGRLAPGASLAQSRAELDTIARALATAYPDSNKERGVLVRGWQESITAHLRPAIFLLFGAVLLVLIIACANVANMLLARAAARQGELAVRFALGASRARVVRQLLTECLLLATLGGIAGLALALWGIDATRLVLQAGGIFEPELDGRALLFAAVVALGSTFAFGLWPALRAARGDLASVVKDGSRSVTGARSRLRATLVVLQVALSFALLVGAALLGRSFLRVAGVEPGFDARGVVTMQLSLPESKDPALFFTRLLDRVQALPDVTAAGITDFLPLSQSNINGGFDIEGKHFDDPNRYTEYMVVSPGYFDTMRMRVVRGRGIGAGDTATSQKVCLINQEMARRWFGGDDPVGKHMRLEWNDADKSWLTVVGLVADSRRFGLDGEPTPETYLPFAQMPYRRMALAVRGRGSAGDLGALVRRQVAAVDPSEATFEVTTMAETVDESLRPRKMLLDFTGFFGAVALALAAIGLYGVLAVQVAQRTRELGIRMALGARPSDVRALVVRQAVALAVVGAGLGAVTALALSSLLTKLLYGVGATDPPTYVAVAVTLVGVAFAAAWLPARRATAIDPMIALRA
jgi:putative ABC transport system permease protein